jgi:hypothetical protein
MNLKRNVVRTSDFKEVARQLMQKELSQMGLAFVNTFDTAVRDKTISERESSTGWFASCSRFAIRLILYSPERMKLLSCHCHTPNIMYSSFFQLLQLQAANHCTVLIKYTVRYEVWRRRCFVRTSTTSLPSGILYTM